MGKRFMTLRCGKYMKYISWTIREKTSIYDQIHMKSYHKEVKIQGTKVRESFFKIADKGLVDRICKELL